MVYIIYTGTVRRSSHKIGDARPCILWAGVYVYPSLRSVFNFLGMSRQAVDDEA